MRIVWSPLAMDKVREQATYIAQDNPAAARRWINDVFAAAEQLEDFPTSGRIVPELRDSNTRELLFDGYRIIYRIEPNHISILTIRHGRRQLPLEDVED